MHKWVATPYNSTEKIVRKEKISKGVMQETKEIIMAIANLTIFLSC